MTIVFGALCTDGALLVSDSLSQERKPNGWITTTLGRKLGTAAGFPYVVSGSVPGEWRPDPALAGTPADVAAVMLRELEFLASHSDDHDQSPTHVLVGGQLPEGGYELALVGSDRAPTLARVGGAPLVAGAMGDWMRATGVTFAAAPDALAHALPYALDRCRQYIRDSWAAFGFEKLADFHLNEPGGYVPSSAPPFHVAVITSTSVDYLEYPE